MCGQPCAEHRCMESAVSAGIFVQADKRIIRATTFRFALTFYRKEQLEGTSLKDIWWTQLIVT